MTEFLNWKANIDRELRELKARVSLLEIEKQDSQRWCKSSLKDGVDEDKMYSESKSIVSDTEELGCIKRWHYHLKSSRTAKFQFLLLLIFFSLFAYFGLSQYNRAKRNVNSLYKPEKKESIKNYEDGKSTEVYDIPYFYFHFYVNLGSNKSNETSIDNTLSLLLASMDNFTGSCVIAYYSEGSGINETQSTLEPIEAVADYDPVGIMTNGFWAWMRIKFDAPDPSKGFFYLMIRLKPGLMSERASVSFDWMFLTISREIKSLHPFRGVLLKESEDFVTIYVVSYEESVTRRIDTENTGSLETDFRHSGTMSPSSVKQHMNVSTNNSDILVVVLPDLLVDHWEEFVEYGYWEWVTAMGGLFSITCAVFFWISYYLGLMFEHDIAEVGILGEMSLIYWNIENIHMMKKLLKQSGIIDNQRLAIGSELATWKREGEH